MIQDLIIERDAPKNRQAKCTAGKEKHLTEAAVMLAFGMHLFRTLPNVRCVKIHPDGEHAKRFNIAGWLNARGFARSESFGSTSYGGTYARDEETVVVKPLSGVGDVVAEVDGIRVVAECKGGILNTRHAGQTSKLRRGLCEAVGLLMSTPREGRQIAVVPNTETTLKLAKKLAPRARDAGIEIALVDAQGNVLEVHPQGSGLT